MIAKVGDAGDVEGSAEWERERRAAAAGRQTIQKDSTEKETATASEPAPAAGSQGPERRRFRRRRGARRRPTAAPPSPASVAALTADGRGSRRLPIAKRIAKDRGVDLHALSGSGPGGRIVKADVEKAVAGAGAAPAAAAAAPAAAAPAGPTAGAQEKPETAKGQVEVIELTKLQQTVARRMAESKATAPHFYLQAEIDMTRAVAGRKKLKEMAGEGEVVPTFNDMIVKACALALREFPRANGAYRDGKIELYSRVNVGVAVAAQDALVVPTVFDADLKGLRQIARRPRRWPSGSATARSRRPSSRGGPSPSPTSACTGSPTSTR